MMLRTHSHKLLPLAHSLIAAGNAVEMVDGYELIDINALVTRGREGFLVLEVTGDSMVDYIHPGNIVFVDPWAEPRNGDIVAATVNGLTAVKIFKRQRERLYLVSANQNYEPREITSRDSFHILGVVKGHLGLHP